MAIYVHGKGGNAEEAAHYTPLLSDYDVIGFDYQAQNPWDAQQEFRAFFDAKRREYPCRPILLIANSIGAFFSMSALSGKQVDKALLISPIVDMERLIRDMMGWANVTEDALRLLGEIPTAFGETLSWDYLCYVREHPLRWNVPMRILYGEKDNLTSRETISAFAELQHAPLCIMPGGEHWFHTAAQLQFLDAWVKRSMASFPDK